MCLLSSFPSDKGVYDKLACCVSYWWFVMDGPQIGDLVVLIFCISLYVIYHLWYFLLKDMAVPWGGGHRVPLWGVTFTNRAMWTEAMMGVRT